MKRCPPSPVIQSLDLTSISTIRTLAFDAVQAANSGHPGTPMAKTNIVLHFHTPAVLSEPYGAKKSGAV